MSLIARYNIKLWQMLKTDEQNYIVALRRKRVMILTLKCQNTKSNP